MGSVYQAVSSASTFNVYLSGDGQMILDINGYFAPASPGGLWYQPTQKPARIIDTRASPALYSNLGPVSANTILNRPFAGASYDGVTIAGDARAASLTIAMLPTGASGYITVWPGPNQGIAARPLVSAGLYNNPMISETAVVAGIGADGTINFSPSATINIVVDVDGYFSGSGSVGFVPLHQPIRLIDTRNSPAYYSNGGVFPGGQARSYQIAGVSYLGVTIPSNAQVVVCTLTAVSQGAGGYVTAWPTSPNRPLASVLLYQPQVFASALGLNVGLNANGELSLYTSSQAHLILDAVGYYMPSASSVVARADTTDTTSVQHSHLTPGAVVAIVIACVLVATILLVAAMVIILRHRRASSDYRQFVVVQE